jgi:hypothetical protein
MTSRRKLLTATFLLVSAAVIAYGALQAYVALQRYFNPPDIVRLLPEGEFLFYANASLLHLFDAKQLNPSQLDPEYQDFVSQTGIQFERDLDEVAMSRRDPDNGADAESSEVFVGRFDQAKLTKYLQKLATSTEKYADKTVFAMSNEGHTVRVCILTDSQVAMTNMTSSGPIHSMVDKFRNSALAAQGPYLAETYYHHVPFGTLAWIVYRLPLQPGAVQLPGGLSFDFLQNTTGVISLRYSGSLHLKAEVFAESAAEAKEVAESAHNYLSLYRSIAQWAGTRGADRDIKKAFDSIQIEQKENRAIFTATIPPAFLKKMTSEAQTGNQGPNQVTPGKRP